MACFTMSSSHACLWSGHSIDKLQHDGGMLVWRLRMRDTPLQRFAVTLDRVRQKISAGLVCRVPSSGRVAYGPLQRLRSSSHALTCSWGQAYIIHDQAAAIPMLTACKPNSSVRSADLCHWNTPGAPPEPGAVRALDWVCPHAAAGRPGWTAAWSRRYWQPQAPQAPLPGLPHWPEFQCG